jgi:ribosome biogenesis GTPase
MDTPGLREIQLWDAEDGVAEVFGDIDELALRCRFSDCRHDGEPGCAVRAALDGGTLHRGRFESRRKLLREQEFLRRKVDPEARLEQKEQWKQVHRAARQKYQQKEKDGGKR